jgi:hypothetical protein
MFPSSTGFDAVAIQYCMNTVCTSRKARGSQALLDFKTGK